MKKIKNVSLLGLFFALIIQLSPTLTQAKEKHYTDKVLFASLVTTAAGLASAAYLVYCGIPVLKNAENRTLVDKAFSAMLFATPFGIPEGSGAVAASFMVASGLSGTIITAAIKCYKSCKTPKTAIVIKQQNVNNTSESEPTNQ